MAQRVPLIVTGADGRLGRLLRLFDGAPESTAFSISWLSRRGNDALVGWDIVQEPAPELPEGGILLHLAAVLPKAGQNANLSDNRVMANAVIQADRAARFSKVVLMSSVAVYSNGAAPMTEDAPLGPISAYGQSKLACEQILAGHFCDRLTILRLANLAGADALLGGADPAVEVILDPVAGQDAGPVRSYIGPKTFADTTFALLAALSRGGVVPAVLNLAQPGSLGMGELMAAAGLRWRFGPARDATVGRAEVDVAKLTRLIPLPAIDAAKVAAELASLKGVWP